MTSVGKVIFGSRSITWVSLAVVLCAYRPVLAEHPEGLPDTLLIESLAREQMGELLDRMQENKAGLDPVSRGLARAARLRVNASDPETPHDQRVNEMASSLEAMRAMIRENPGHPLNPVWSVDLARLLLFEYLPLHHQNACEFYEFGVTTTSQRSAFETNVAEALDLVTRAELELTNLATDTDDHARSLVETGLWPRMLGDYRQQQIPFLFGHAAYYTSLLSDEHPYFQDGAESSARSSGDIDAERTRLLRTAAERLRELAESDKSEAGLVEAATCLRARVLTRLSRDEAGNAIALLDDVISTASDNPTKVIATLAKAVAIDALGRQREALDEIDQLERVPSVAGSATYRLLSADLMHRMLMSQARADTSDQKQEFIAAAYDPYRALLEDAALGEQRLGVRHIVFRRWDELCGDRDSDLAGWPTFVLCGVGELARIEGQNLMAEANSLTETGQVGEAEKLAEQAAPKLARVITVNGHLLKRSSLAEDDRAGAMFDLAMARYFQALGKDDQGVMQAVSIWLELARELPERPEAIEAIGHAIGVLRWLIDSQPSNATYAETYVEAVEALFKDFPDSPAAGNERFYYASAVLIPTGRYAEAAEILASVPLDHQEFHPAQRQMLVCLKLLFDQAEKVADKNTAEHRLDQAARSLISRFGERGERVVDGSDPNLARRTVGWARLALIDTALDRGDTHWAVGELDDLSSLYGRDPEVMAGIMERAITGHLHSGELERAVSSAKRMMELMPDDAAAVIDEALRRLDQRVDRIRFDAEQTLVDQKRRALEQQALGISRAGHALASLLLDWAQQKGMDEDGLLPFKLGLAKALRRSQKPREALHLLEPIAERYGDDPAVIFNIAEALYLMADDRTHAEAAIKRYDTLILGLEGQADTESRRIWWHSSMRRLQISDLLGSNVRMIPLRVKQLEFIDDELGGEPYRSEFRRLAVKHGGRTLTQVEPE